MSSASLIADDTHASESTPLLSQSDNLVREQERGITLGKPALTPLPWTQLAVIYVIKLMLPVANQQILPYINRMIEGLVRPGEKSVGYYSGLASTGSTAGAFLSVYFWGRLSDSFGRKPILIVGLTSLSIATIAFGLSTTFPILFIFRFLGGVCGGFVGVIHSVVGELSDPTNQSTAFPFYDVISALGFIIGPIIGGTFAEPAKEYPVWFDSEFWRRFPYFLPCLIIAIFGLTTALLAIFLLRETNPLQARSVNDATAVGEGSALVEEPMEINVVKAGLQSLLGLPAIRAVCASQFMLGFLGASFNGVFVLMAYTQIENGGLSLSPRKIALALSIMGFVSIGLKLSLPIFLRRFDTLDVYSFTMKTWPITFGLMPFLNIIARRATASGVYQSAEAEAGLWIAISFVLFMSRLGCLAFSIVMIVTKDHTPTSIGLGTTNSVSELSQMIGGAVGAPLASSLFAYSISGQVFFGYFWVIIMCVLSLFGDYSVSRIRRQHS